MQRRVLFCEAARFFSARSNDMTELLVCTPSDVPDSSEKAIENGKGASFPRISLLAEEIKTGNIRLNINISFFKH